MKPQGQVHAYYENIAAEYDHGRFGNGYGRYLHRQEAAFLEQWLPKGQNGWVLNLGCGTGRFMELATDGLDFSENMLSIAQQRFAAARFHCSDARKMPFANASFDAVFCLHVLMHLDEPTALEILHECGRILKPGGLLVLDFPSKKRRQLLGHQQNGWHGATSYSVAGFLEMADAQFELAERVGALFFPIHRLSSELFLNLIYPIDTALCRSPFREFSSYLLLALRRR